MVMALLGGTAAAFAVTQGLKQTKSPVFRTHVTKRFSPAKGAIANVNFGLRRADHVTLTIENSSGRVVRVLVDTRPLSSGSHRFAWKGVTDEGRRAPDGVYRARVSLDDADRVITLPNRIRLDTTPPTIRVVGQPVVGGRVLTVHYRVSEPARAALYLGGRRVLLTYRRPLTGVLRLPLPTLSNQGIAAITAVDEAGNMSKPRPIRVS